jgi:hypothetical protein
MKPWPCHGVPEARREMGPRGALLTGGTVIHFSPWSSRAF